MILFAGLGNPGSKHEHDRHNIGFLVADEIARNYSFSLRKARHHSYVAQGKIAGKNILLLKPKTFMNDSGRALGSAARYYKIRPLQVKIFHDDLDLVPGKVRVKTGGGHAGHNGVRSIISHIGQDFKRIRIGIGHPGDRKKVHNYVLSKFPNKDMEWVHLTVKAISDSLPILVEGDDVGFMTRVAYLAPPANCKPAELT